MNAHTNTRHVVIERKGDRTPHKPKAWSHQIDLQRFRGKRIELRLLTGSQVGVLVEADQFTLKILPDNNSTLTYFKHAITGYGLVKE